MISVRNRYHYNNHNNNNNNNSHTTDEDQTTLSSSFADDERERSRTTVIITAVSDDEEIDPETETDDLSELPISTMSFITNPNRSTRARISKPALAPTPPILLPPNPTHFLSISHPKLLNLEYTLLRPATHPSPTAPYPSGRERDSGELLRRSLIIHRAVVRAELEVRVVRERREREREREMTMLGMGGAGARAGAGVRGWMDVRSSGTRESIVEVSEDEEQDDDEEDGITLVPTYEIRTAITTPPSSLSTASVPADRRPLQPISPDTNYQTFLPIGTVTPMLDIAHKAVVEEEDSFERTWRELHADDLDLAHRQQQRGFAVVEPDLEDHEEYRDERDYEDEVEESRDGRVKFTPGSFLFGPTPAGTSDWAHIAFTKGEDVDEDLIPLLDLTASPFQSADKLHHQDRSASSSFAPPLKPVLRPTLVKDKFYTGLARGVTSSRSETVSTAVLFATPTTPAAAVEVSVRSSEPVIPTTLPPAPGLESDDEDVDAAESDEDGEECVTPTQDILDDFASSSTGTATYSRSSSSPSAQSKASDTQYRHDGYAYGGVPKSTAQRSTLWGRDVFEAGEEAGEW